MLTCFFCNIYLLVHSLDTLRQVHYVATVDIIILLPQLPEVCSWLESSAILPSSSVYSPSSWIESDLDLVCHHIHREPSEHGETPRQVTQSTCLAFLHGNSPWKQNSQLTCHQSVWDTQNLGLCCWSCGSSHRLPWVSALCLITPVELWAKRIVNSGCVEEQWTEIPAMSFINLIQPHSLNERASSLNSYLIKLNYIRLFYTTIWYFNVFFLF